MKITNFIPKTLTGYLVAIGAAVLSGCTPTPAPALVQHLMYAVVCGVVLFLVFNFIEQLVDKYNNLLWGDGGLVVTDKNKDVKSLSKPLLQGERWISKEELNNEQQKFLFGRYL
jgi:hypothetical protein